MENNTLRSIYAPLDSTRREIRLLELLPIPDDEDTLVSWTISVVSLDDQPDYTALSYVWGDASITGTILLNGVRTTVTRNLATALQHLPKNGRVQSYMVKQGVFRIWADAICIDQGNIQERNQQVLLMADLYSSADHVFSWLGTANCIPRAINTLRRIYFRRIFFDIDTVKKLEWLRWYPELYEVQIPPEQGVLIPNQYWEAVRDFIHLPYWSRMWIFQEIILSRDKRLTFLGDGVSIEDSSLREALGCLRQIGASLGRQKRPDFISEDEWGYLQRLHIVGESGAQVQSLLVAKMLLSRETGAQRPGLCLLAAFGRVVQATDSRDYYYSLIGVSGLALKPDYSSNKLVHEVCLEFVRAYLDATAEATFPLLFLHDAIGPEGPVYHGLPSWAPRYHLPLEGTACGADSDANADLGLFETLLGGKRPRPTLSPDNRTMHMLGVKVTTISFLAYRRGTEFLRTGAIVTYLIDFAQRHGPIYRTGISTATALFSTLEKQLDGQQYDSRKASVILSILFHHNPGPEPDELDSTTITTQTRQALMTSIHDESLAFENLNQLDAKVYFTEFWQTMAGSERVKAERLFETEEGYLGLVPREAEVGDLVCILDGFRYPVVLRERGEVFIFIGVCFVSGLMVGEAKRLWDAGSGPTNVFTVI
jgi:hypothetical protein